LRFELRVAHLLGRHSSPLATQPTYRKFKKNKCLVYCYVLFFSFLRPSAFFGPYNRKEIVKIIFKSFQFWFSSASFLYFKWPCYYTAPTLIIQQNLPIPRTVTLTASVNPLVVWGNMLRFLGLGHSPLWGREEEGSEAIFFFVQFIKLTSFMLILN
jgi:hypothetical protein